jgi:hypothetical protein
VRRIVKCRDRFVVVMVDDVLHHQCSVMAPAIGGTFFVNGTGPKSIQAAADYARDFGISYRTRRGARGLLTN